MTIGDRLKEERERLGYTQPAFAALAGTTKKSQIDYEKGVSQPRAGYLAAIAAVGADISYVATGIRVDAGMASAMLRASDEIRRVNTLSQALGIAEQGAGGYSAGGLTLRERRLLDHYRKAPPDGQRAIEATAKALAKE